MATKAKSNVKPVAKVRKLPANTMKWMTLLVFVVAAGVVGSYMALQSHAGTCYDYSWGRGNSGTCVKYIQQLVNYQYGHLSTDGSFGPLTQSGVKTVQGNYGLTRDGIVGPHTWHVLCNPRYSLAPGDTTVAFAKLATAAGCKTYTSGTTVHYN